MPVPPEVAAWLDDGCAALLERASSSGRRSTAQRAKDSDEARLRSHALSTTADKTGVSFRGREFQRLYFEQRYVRRATLIYQLIGSVLSSGGAARDLFVSELTAAGGDKRKLEVCSVGGGPGTDAAGLVAANSRWLGFAPGGGAWATEADTADEKRAHAAVRAAAAEAAKAAAVARERSEAHAKRARSTAAKAASLREAAVTAAASASAAAAAKATAACDKAEAAAAAAAESAAAAASAASAAEAKHKAAAADLALAVSAREGGGEGGAGRDGEAAVSLHVSLLDNEAQWKSYTATLGRTFAPHGATVDFGVCDVTAPLAACSDAVAATLARADALLFAFVCHETSRASAAADWAFYRELRRSCKLGAVLIFTDVVGHSAQCFDEVHAAMASGAEDGRAVRRLPLAAGLGEALHAELMVLHVAKHSGPAAQAA